MERVVGKRMYRGLLKTIARVWNPKEIQDKAIQEKVLAHMQAAERGLRRAEAAREKAGLAAFAGVLGVFEIEFARPSGQSQITARYCGRARRQDNGRRFDRIEIFMELYIIAGPNGAGKTTFAREFLPNYADCKNFVNADLIAQGMAPFSPETAALRAGRAMLGEIRSFAKQRVSFAFEPHYPGEATWL